jgi:hypothetical protein
MLVSVASPARIFFTRGTRERLRQSTDKQETEVGAIHRMSGLPLRGGAIGGYQTVGYGARDPIRIICDSALQWLKPLSFQRV